MPSLTSTSLASSMAISPRADWSVALSRQALDASIHRGPGEIGKDGLRVPPLETEEDLDAYGDESPVQDAPVGEVTGEMRQFPSTIRASGRSWSMCCLSVSCWA